MSMLEDDRPLEPPQPKEVPEWVYDHCVQAFLNDQEKLKDLMASNDKINDAVTSAALADLAGRGKIAEAIFKHASKELEVDIAAYKEYLKHDRRP